jgi:hypothetical protein
MLKYWSEILAPITIQSILSIVGQERKNGKKLLDDFAVFRKSLQKVYLCRQHGTDVRCNLLLYK